MRTTKWPYRVRVSKANAVFTLSKWHLPWFHEWMTTASCISFCRYINSFENFLSFGGYLKLSPFSHPLFWLAKSEYQKHLFGPVLAKIRHVFWTNKWCWLLKGFNFAIWQSWPKGRCCWKVFLFSYQDWTELQKENKLQKCTKGTYFCCSRKQYLFQRVNWSLLLIQYKVWFLL